MLFSLAGLKTAHCNFHSWPGTCSPLQDFQAGGWVIMLAKITCLSGATVHRGQESQSGPISMQSVVAAALCFELSDPTSHCYLWFELRDPVSYKRPTTWPRFQDWFQKGEKQMQSKINYAADIRCVFFAIEDGTITATTKYLCDLAFWSCDQLQSENVALTLLAIGYDLPRV